MKVSLNWLRELVELPPSVPQLVDLLTLAGVEVEGVVMSRAELMTASRANRPYGNFKSIRITAAYFTMQSRCRGNGGIQIRVVERQWGSADA